MEWFFLALAFVFGASWASFFGVVIERNAARESLGGRSHCVCGRQLTWYENIPVVSWLALGGKTRCCGKRIPIWYLVSELLAGAISSSLAWWGIHEMGVL